MAVTSVNGGAEFEEFLFYNRNRNSSNKQQLCVWKLTSAFNMPNGTTTRLTMAHSSHEALLKMGDHLTEMTGVNMFNTVIRDLYDSYGPCAHEFIAYSRECRSLDEELQAAVNYIVDHRYPYMWIERVAEPYWI